MKSAITVLQINSKNGCTNTDGLNLSKNQSEEVGRNTLVRLNETAPRNPMRIQWMLISIGLGHSLIVIKKVESNRAVAMFMTHIMGPPQSVSLNKGH